MDREEFLRLARLWPSRSALARDLGVTRQMVHYYIHGESKMGELRAKLMRELAEGKRDGE